jgi:hypothetical protein
VSESYRKLRGTLRFLLGSLADFDPAAQCVPYEQLPAVDRFVLGRHAEVMEEVKEAYETYQVGGGGGGPGATCRGVGAPPRGQGHQGGSAGRARALAAAS